MRKIDEMKEKNANDIIKDVLLCHCYVNGFFRFLVHFILLNIQVACKFLFIKFSSFQ